MVTKLSRTSFFTLLFIALIGGIFPQAFAMGGRTFTKGKTFKRFSSGNSRAFLRDLITGSVKKSVLLDDKDETNSVQTPRSPRSKLLLLKGGKNSRAAFIGAIAHITTKGSRVSSDFRLSPKDNPKNSLSTIKQKTENISESAVKTDTLATVENKLSQEKSHNLLDKILVAFYVKVSSLLEAMKSIGSLQFNDL